MLLKCDDKYLNANLELVDEECDIWNIGSNPQRSIGDHIKNKTYFIIGTKDENNITKYLQMGISYGNIVLMHERPPSHLLIKFTINKDRIIKAVSPKQSIIDIYQGALIENEKYKRMQLLKSQSPYSYVLK